MRFAIKNQAPPAPPAPPSRGLGDTIATLTRATGIERAVQAMSRLTGIPCRCQYLRERLNRAIPYA